MDELQKLLIQLAQARPYFSLEYACGKFRVNLRHPPVMLGGYEPKSYRSPVEAARAAVEVINLPGYQEALGKAVGAFNSFDAHGRD